jgi:hypothetical protein
MHDVGVIDELPWRTSTRCASSGCVRVARTDTAVYVGDTKPGGEADVLQVGLGEWAAFVGAVSRG